MVSLFLFLALMGAYVWIRYPWTLSSTIGFGMAYFFVLTGLSWLDESYDLPIALKVGASLLGGGAMVFWAVRSKGCWSNMACASVSYFLLLTLISGLVLWVTEAMSAVAEPTPTCVSATVSLPDGMTRSEDRLVIESRENQGLDFVDAWYTEVSAACVTGSISRDFSRFSLAGQIVTLVTIQLGGLGIIFLTTLIAWMVSHSESTREAFDRITTDALDVQHQFMRSMFWQILGYTFFIEALSIVVLGVYFQWYADAAPLDGTNPWWWSTFHVISAFNNAGFSLHPDNLVGFVKDPMVCGVIAGNIILGGLGYPVLARLFLSALLVVVGRTRATRSIIGILEQVEASHIQSRVAYQGTLILLAIGTLLPLVWDASSSSYAGLAPTERIMAVSFHSVSTRTAGFNVSDIGQVSTPTTVLYMFLMYVGACSMGTAGGIKIMTMLLLAAYVWNWQRKPYQHVLLFDSPFLLFDPNQVEQDDGEMKTWVQDWTRARYIDRDTMAAAIKLFFASILLLVGVTLVISANESHLLACGNGVPFLNIAFEIMSHFGTVGLSRGYEGAVTSLSGILQPESRIMLTLVMLVGRLGPLTVLAMFPWSDYHSVSDLVHPVEPNKRRFQVG